MQCDIEQKPAMLASVWRVNKKDEEAAITDDEPVALEMKFCQNHKPKGISLFSFIFCISSSSYIVSSLFAFCLIAVIFFILFFLLLMIESDNAECRFGTLSDYGKIPSLSSCLPTFFFHSYLFYFRRGEVRK